MKFPLVVSVLMTATTQAMFRFDCHNYVVVERSDPIVSPGEKSAHVHAVAGGNGFNSNATFQDMSASSCTSCPIADDLSAYWMPQLYVEHKDGSGYSLVDGHLIVYYFQEPSDDEVVEPFPDNLRMVAGDYSLRERNDSSIEQQAIEWQCIDYKWNYPPGTHIPNEKCPEGLRAQVNFPKCVQKGKTDSEDHKSHLKYNFELHGGACPEGYIKIPLIKFEAFYNVKQYASEWKDDGTHPYVLATGDRTGYGFHGDFLNGWKSETLRQANEECGIDNHFDINKCAPLAKTYRREKPEQLCTLDQEFKEDVKGPFPKLPGNNPVDEHPPPRIDDKMYEEHREKVRAKKNGDPEYDSVGETGGQYGGSEDGATATSSVASSQGQDGYQTSNAHSTEMDDDTEASQQDQPEAYTPANNQKGDSESNPQTDSPTTSPQGESGNDALSAVNGNSSEGMGPSQTNQFDGTGPSNGNQNADTNTDAQFTAPGSSSPQMGPSGFPNEKSGDMEQVQESVQANPNVPEASVGDNPGMETNPTQGAGVTF